MRNGKRAVVETNCLLSALLTSLPVKSSRAKSKKRQRVDASSPSLTEQQQQQHIKNVFQTFDVEKTGEKVGEFPFFYTLRKSSINFH
jgi:predicted nucleic acid-binding protein